MKIFLDTADLESIRRCYAYYPVDGVTTNPSILAAAKRDPWEVLKEIRAFIGQDAALHVQAVSGTAEGIVKEAASIRKKLGENTYIKIPVVPEGLKAICILTGEGVRVTATGIYTVQQAFLAAHAGADYAAPYVNRIDNLGAEGVRTVCRIQDCYSHCGYKTQILAASFKNTQQVISLAEYGIGSITVAPEILDGMLKNPAVDAAVKAFSDDFAGLCGPGATME